MAVADAKALLRRVDNHGLHTTGALRERADEPVEAAAERSPADE